MPHHSPLSPTLPSKVQVAGGKSRMRARRGWGTGRPTGCTASCVFVPSSEPPDRTSQPSGSNVRIAIIVNASDPSEVEQLRVEVERLRAGGHEVRPRLTFEGGDAEQMAGDAVEWGADVVVAAGGDGTVNEVGNGMHAAVHHGAGERPRLAIVPLGTGNDLASSIGVPAGIPDAMALAVSGRGREMDVGTVGGRCFLNASTGGIGAEATEEAPARVKRALGILAYAITGAKKFAALRPSRARFTAGGVLHDGPFLLFAVGNSDRTGGGNLLTPRARLDDGLLDVCVVKEMTRMEFARLLPELRTGRHLDHPAVLYRQVTELLVEAEEELSVNADGEPLGGCRRIEYALSPRKLLLTRG